MEHYLGVTREERITEEVTGKLRKWLPDQLKPKIVKDTGLVTGWIREAILRICREEP